MALLWWSVADMSRREFGHLAGAFGDGRGPREEYGTMTYQGWQTLHSTILYLTDEWRESETEGFAMLADRNDRGCELVRDGSRAYVALEFLERHLALWLRAEGVDD